MAGLISGFIGGLSKGIADVGRMEFDNQMKNEREEASYLRDKELSGSKRRYLTSERIAGQEFKAKENAKKLEDKANSAGKLTNQSKNINDLMTRGLSQEEAMLKVYPSSKIDYTDKQGNQIVVIPDGKGNDGKPKYKEVGRFSKDNNDNPLWLNSGEQTENAKVTKLDRDEAQKRADKKDKFTNFDETDFPSTGGDIKEWRKQESQRIANERRAAKKGGGIVNNAMKPKSDTMLPGGEIVEETKMLGNRKVSKAEFMRRMKKKYKDATMADLESRWTSITSK